MKGTYTHVFLLVLLLAIYISAASLMLYWFGWFAAGIALNISLTAGIVVFIGGYLKSKV